MQSNGKFRTTDLYLTAFLECINYQITLEDGEQGRVVFIVTDTENRKADIQKYYNNTAQVSPKAYADSIKNLKSMLINSK